MSKIKLCCIFNYAPLYRESIYKMIDEEFDAQFCFSDIVSDVEKLDYNIFRKKPITIRDRHILGTPLVWRKDIIPLLFKDYTHYLVIGDAPISYFPFILIAHFMKKKVFAWGHGYKSFSGKMGWYLRWLSKHFDLFFTYGERNKQRMMELGVNENRIDVIYNSLNSGVSSSEQHHLKSDIISSHFKNTDPTLLFVGRLTKVKQLNWIVDALAYHKSKGLNYNLLIIGDGSEKEQIIEHSKTKFVYDNIWFYGKCYVENTIASLIYNSDLCVSPGNVGLTALHAMSYGTPVISNDDFETQMPEYETIISNKTGNLYQKGNFEDFCVKIEEWLSARYDREEIRNNCYDVINGKFNSKYQINLFKKHII